MQDQLTGLTGADRVNRDGSLELSGSTARDVITFATDEGTLVSAQRTGMEIATVQTFSAGELW